MISLSLKLCRLPNDLNGYQQFRKSGLPPGFNCSAIRIK